MSTQTTTTPHDSSGPLFGRTALYRLQIFSIWCGPIFTICMAIGWLGLAQGLNPYDPSSTAGDLAHSYAAHDTRFILGCTIFLIGCGILTFWVAQLSIMMAAIEGRRPILAIAQLIGGIGVVMFVSSACCLWIGAAYRSGVANPDVTSALNDAGWFTFMLTWPGLTVQVVAAGLVVWAGRNRADRLAPGWVGISCFVSGAVIALVGLVSFTKTGPFAWNGPLGCYVPFAVWGGSFEILSWSMTRTLRRRHRETESGGASPAPTTHDVAGAPVATAS